MSGFAKSASDYCRITYGAILVRSKANNEMSLHPGSGRLTDAWRALYLTPLRELRESYELGGSTRAWRVVLIHWTPETSQLEWGGTAPGDLKKIDEVSSDLLSGLIKGSAGPW